MSGRDQLPHNLFPIDLIKVRPVQFRILMGYDKTVTVYDQGIAFSEQFDLLGGFLYMIDDHIEGDDIAAGTVIQKFRDGDDHVLCLGIHIR